MRVSTFAASRATPAETAVRRNTSARDEEDERAGRLVQRLSALPSSHPDRRALRDQAIEAWLPMAYRLARRYARRGDLLDDLRQVATIGLIKAVDGFDALRGTDFPGYAIPTITGEMKRYFRDRTWFLRVPRRLQELRLDIGEAQTQLSNSLGRSPTVADIAVYLEVSEDAVLEGLESGYAYSALSLSNPVGDDAGLTLGDTIGSTDQGYDSVEFHVAMPPVLALLTERERQIIILRFYGNLTQGSIAEKVGVSQMHVSRILAGALAKLRERLADAS